MKIAKKIIFMMLLTMAMMLIYSNNVFAEYVIQVVPTSATNPAWTYINTSDAYDACQALNTNYSTLGTDKLKAHLTTNADWYAVSLLTYSSYGNKNASNTTGNKSGIMNFGTNWTVTSSLMDGYNASDNNLKSLVQALSTNSAFVESVQKNSYNANNRPGRGLLASEYLTTSLGGRYYGDSTGYPVVARNSLFGLAVGSDNNYFNYASGAASSATFRPVIWN